MNQNKKDRIIELYAKQDKTSEEAEELRNLQKEELDEE